MQWQRIAEEDQQERAKSTEGVSGSYRRLSIRTVVCTLALAAALVAVVVIGSSPRFHRTGLQTQDELELKAEVQEGPIFGGEAASAAFEGFVNVWRGLYADGTGYVPELASDSLPAAFRDVRSKVVLSGGGAAEGGVVTEGIGYSMMVEGVRAAAGDKTSLTNGLSLMKAWLGMVNGPEGTLKNNQHVVHPLGGGAGQDIGAATKVDVPPYGVSAILPQGPAAKGISGVAAWKYPLDACSWGLCLGSATDADEDAIFGMIHLAKALNFPDDFTDTVMRAVIAMASADLGFPDMYRTLPDGQKIFVPKGGSMWGGLNPGNGRFSGQFAGCYNPSYFSPGSYRLFKQFAETHWKPEFQVYMPPHTTGQQSTLAELLEAFDGAVIGGYNLLYRSSCSSGAVSNWVGSQADCPDPNTLNCPGVPWASTPHVGSAGTCSVSGTKWGSWGKDASRSPWRIAMDYAMFPAEASQVTMYDTAGNVDHSIDFNAKTYLNRLANQYVQHARCNGGKPGDCNTAQSGRTDPQKLAPAFVADLGAPDLTCQSVPNAPEPNWWAAEMSHPTFTGFVAPANFISASESKSWLETFAKLCDFSNLGNYDDMDTTHGLADICSKNYFQASQQVVSAMVASGALKPLSGVGAGQEVPRQLLTMVKNLMS